MNSSEILAIVVSYNGIQTTADCVKALSEQVGGVLVVDNGSDEASLACLSPLLEEGRVTLECLGSNHGIGYALNVGARFARAHGYRWVLTMDQDSLVDKSMIPLYIRAVEEHPAWVDRKSTRLNSSHRL